MEISLSQYWTFKMPVGWEFLGFVVVSVVSPKTGDRLNVSCESQSAQRLTEADFDLQLFTFL